MMVIIYYFSVHYVLYASKVVRLSGKGKVKIVIEARAELGAVGCYCFCNQCFNCYLVFRHILAIESCPYKYYCILNAF